MSIFQKQKIHWTLPLEVQRNYPYGGPLRGQAIK